MSGFGLLCELDGHPGDQRRARGELTGAYARLMRANLLISHQARRRRNRSAASM